MAENVASEKVEPDWWVRRNPSQLPAILGHFLLAGGMIIARAQAKIVERFSSPYP